MGKYFVFTGPILNWKVDHFSIDKYRRFKNYKEMLKSFNRYRTRYNNISRKVLNFKTPNEVVDEYFSKNAA